MTRSYDAFEKLSQHNAVLHESVELRSGVQLAAWSNKRDTITQYCDHHTLSLYVADGYESCCQKRVNLPGISATTSRSCIFTALTRICVKSGKKSGIKALTVLRWMNGRLATIQGLQRFTASFYWATTGTSLRIT